VIQWYGSAVPYPNQNVTGPEHCLQTLSFLEHVSISLHNYLEHPLVHKPLLRTSGFWPRVRARALRAPVFLGSLTWQTGRCAPPHCSFAAPPPPKKNCFQKQNASLQAQTRAGRGVCFSTGLNCTLLNYIAPY
jgi:hypothetical protein